MSKKISSIRGMNDLLPADSGQWQRIEASLIAVLRRYCYQEIRFPILESTQLFKRSVGEATDIVEKEMYTFLDRNEESVTLRPEGTAGCVRAADQNGLLYNQIQRLWYKGPMFRYERPQKGRMRQFHQIGAETFGIDSVDIDVEIILLTASMFKQLNIIDSLVLELNCIGDSEARAQFGKALVEFLDQHQSELDADSVKRLSTNPLRILDSKDSKTQGLLDKAPKLNDFLSDDSNQRFQLLCQHLDSLGVAYKINPRLVRGLDYYNDTVFEWVTEHLGAQSTVCSGGRYDSLVETLGGKPTPAIGFGMGLERLMLLLEVMGQLGQPKPATEVMVIAADQKAKQQAFKIAEALRGHCTGASIQMSCGNASLKSQLKKADKSGALVAVVIGEQELADESYQLKFLRDDRESRTLQKQELISDINEFLNSYSETH